MANKNIRKEVKKKKKADTEFKPSSVKPIMTQPEIIKKPKKKES